jgi:hypothetical protein
MRPQLGGATSSSHSSVESTISRRPLLPSQSRRQCRSRLRRVGSRHNSVDSVRSYYCQSIECRDNYEPAILVVSWQMKRGLTWRQSCSSHVSARLFQKDVMMATGIDRNDSSNNDISLDRAETCQPRCLSVGHIPTFQSALYTVGFDDDTAAFLELGLGDYYENIHPSSILSISASPSSSASTTTATTARSKYDDHYYSCWCYYRTTSMRFTVAAFASLAQRQFHADFANQQEY